MKCWPTTNFNSRVQLCAVNLSCVLRLRMGISILIEEHGLVWSMDRWLYGSTNTTNFTTDDLSPYHANGKSLGKKENSPHPSLGWTRHIAVRASFHLDFVDFLPEMINQPLFRNRNSPKMCGDAAIFVRGSLLLEWQSLFWDWWSTGVRTTCRWESISR